MLREESDIEGKDTVMVVEFGVGSKSHKEDFEE